jgi:hypothetical protein
MLRVLNAWLAVERYGQALEAPGGTGTWPGFPITWRRDLRGLHEEATAGHGSRRAEVLTSHVRYGDIAAMPYGPPRDERVAADGTPLVGRPARLVDYCTRGQASTQARKLSRQFLMLCWRTVSAWKLSRQSSRHTNASTCFGSRQSS